MNVFLIHLIDHLFPSRAQQGSGGEIGATALPVLGSSGSYGESLLGEAHDTLAGGTKTSVGLTISASHCFMQNKLDKPSNDTNEDWQQNPLSSKKTV
ncbi:unnamed protein product [Darwinula stevensoni]|uniref:Uncharacterized protein n=1 Tax=Darwinula stevensoni TaxID=69355 RepID=A0A7R9AEQ4_9CRUS|nr:unnamed protein product [Darwinula stevensoni]CAG0901861.1 unnamed protein product [Darwinula stevensoni]